MQACGQAAEAWTKKVDLAEKAMTNQNAEEQNDAEMYLDDVLDSASETSAAAGPTDPSVADDLKAEKIKKMVTKMFERFDADKSQTLSLDEFLAAPKARAQETQCSPEKEAQMIAKLTEEFKKYAGEDSQLSTDEAQKWLTEVGPRVGKHRGEKHPEGQGQRKQKSFADVLSRFDADKDGKLSESEFNTWQESKKPGKGHGPEGDGPEGHGPHGHGPEGHAKNGPKLRGYGSKGA